MVTTKQRWPSPALPRPPLAIDMRITTSTLAVFFHMPAKLDRSYVGCIERGEVNVALINITKLAADLIAVQGICATAHDCRL